MLRAEEPQQDPGRHGQPREEIRSHHGRYRQHRQSRPRQRQHHRPAARHALLCQRPGAHPRPVPQHRRAHHVGQCRDEPVPSADRRAELSARHHRPGDPGPRRAARAAQRGEEASRGHQVLVPRDQRRGRDHLSVGQPHHGARARSGAVRPGAARHGLHRVRRAARHRARASPASTARSWARPRR